jgi:hypothetical protein
MGITVPAGGSIFDLETGLPRGAEGISSGHPCGICSIHTTHRGELEKARRPKDQNARHTHGSSFTGDCAQALHDPSVMLREVFGRQK